VADLAGKVVVVVGGTAAIGQGLASQLLAGGATVVVPSRSAEKLKKLRAELGSPAGLATLHGGFAAAAAGEGEEGGAGTRSIAEQIKFEFGSIDAVVAHGGLIRSDTLGSGIVGKSLLSETSANMVLEDTTQLLGLHLRAAFSLLPLLEETAKQKSPYHPSYTLITSGLNSSAELTMGAEAPAMTSLYGLGIALRNATKTSSVRVNEIRVALQVNRAERERMLEPRSRPLSLDIGRLASYLMENGKESPSGLRLRARSSEELEGLLQHFSETKQTAEQAAMNQAATT
jgi:NAD(P)-dependent dehydrogenase (short-subunit alcohol dehydrogenase family)